MINPTETLESTPRHQGANRGKPLQDGANDFLLFQCVLVTSLGRRFAPACASRFAAMRAGTGASQFATADTPNLCRRRPPTP